MTGGGAALRLNLPKEVHHAYERETHRDARPPDQRDPRAHGADRQPRYPTQRAQALGGVAGRRNGRGAAQRAGAARVDQGEGEAGGPLGAASSARVRWRRPRLPRACVHERGAGLQYGSGGALRRGRTQLGKPADPAQVRHRGAEAEVAGSVNRGQDGVRLLDDRARLGRLRSALDQDHGAPRGRPVGDRRAQMVHLERVSRRLPDRHVPHGRERSRQRPHDADHRAQGHTGRSHRARCRDLGPAERPLRDHLRRRARAARQPARPGGARAIRPRRIVSERGASITA